MGRITRLSWYRVTHLTALGLRAWGTIIAAPVLAATVTSNVSVTAIISNNCTISTATVAFGAYDPIAAHTSSPLNGTGTVTVTCTSGASTLIMLGQGNNPNPSSTDAAPKRRMQKSGGSRLSYSLYSNASRTTVWGNTAGSGVAHTGTGTATAITVYGKVDPGQNVPAGSYADTVIATVSF